MPLGKGTRLGVYEVVGAIGAGGMGEVYRARDTRLGRDVAIKVLARGQPSSPKARERFEREARAVSSLNHPHICTLYDVGREGDTDFLVMEYLEGQTLAKRIEKGPLPPGELLRVGADVADALECAHRRGVIHRDLKPGNIMLTGAGAKLMDFGLARFSHRQASPLDETASLEQEAAGQAAPLTAEGTMVGTFQYMSPEQVEGREADTRSDIFAFGAVLYEMATGKRAFDGKSQASIAAAILEHEPRPIGELQPASPPALDRAVKTCLAKDPNERFQSAHDVKLQLEWMRDAGSQTVAAAAPVRVALWRRVTPWAIAALAVLVSVAAVLFRPAPAAMPQRKFEINVDKLVANWIGHPEISPDGTMIAYASGDALLVRDLDHLASRKLYALAKNSGLGLGTPIFWSPDSREIGFSDQGKLWRIAATGGTPTEICGLPHPILGAAWGADGEIIFSAWRHDLYEVSAQGGSPEALGAIRPSEEVDFHQLNFLPGGRDLLYVVHRLDGTSRIGVLVNGKRKTLLALKGQWVRFPSYSPAGFLLYGEEQLPQQQSPQNSQGASHPSSFWSPTETLGPQATQDNIWAVPFSPATLSVTGAPFLVAGNAMRPSLSLDGTLIYEPPMPPRRGQLVWVSRKGTIETTIGQPQEDLRYPALSPDGKRAAVDALGQSGNENIWIYDVARGVRTALLSTTAGQSDFTPAWTLNGSQIVFGAVMGISTNIWLQASDGSGSTQRLLENMWMPRPSPRGDYLTAESAPTPGTHRVCYVPLVAGRPEQGAKPVCLPPTDSINEDMRISPDERYAAYSAGDAAQRNVYITRFPTGEGRWRVSADGGHSPVWSPRGDELFYIADGSMMSVHVTIQPSLQLGVPVKLFSLGGERLTSETDQPGPTFDISLDGQRFLMVQGVGEEPPGKIVVDQNWHAAFANRKQN